MSAPSAYKIFQYSDECIEIDIYIYIYIYIRKELAFNYFQYDP